MEERLRELIAIGASVTANCQPCLEYHTAKALENGSQRAEIMEAIEVGKMVRKGAAAKMDKLILKLDGAAPAAEGLQNKGCGCSS